MIDQTLSKHPAGARTSARALTAERDALGDGRVPRTPAMISIEGVSHVFGSRPFRSQDPDDLSART